MAQLKSPAGVQGISGSFGELFFRTLPNGKIVVFLRNKRERTKPPTEKEIKIHQRFAEVNKEFMSLSVEQWNDAHREWRDNHGQFNGKSYHSFRSYYFAKRMYELNHASDLEPLVITQPVVITNKPS